MSVGIEISCFKLISPSHASVFCSGKIALSSIMSANANTGVLKSVIAAKKREIAQTKRFMKQERIYCLIDKSLDDNRVFPKYEPKRNKDGANTLTQDAMAYVMKKTREQT